MRAHNYARMVWASPPKSSQQRTRNAVKHFNVSWNGREFCFGFGTFPSVEALLDHFNHAPVIGGERGE